MRRFWRLAGLAAFAAGLCGCMSQAVEMNAARKSSVPGVGWIDFGKGEVKYALDSWGWVNSIRRRAALRRIKRFCRKRGYRIVSEFEKQETAVPYSSEDLADNLAKGVSHYKVDPFQHLVFECAAPPKE